MSGFYPIRSGVNEGFERAYLEAGAEPPWVRVTHDGVDVTDSPELWRPEDAQRRAEWEERKAYYLREMRATQ